MIIALETDDGKNKIKNCTYMLNVMGGICAQRGENG